MAGAQFAAAALPPELAATVTAAVNGAFIDALDVGMLVGVGLMVVAAAAAVVMLPWRVRTLQAEVDDHGTPAETLIREDSAAVVRIRPFASGLTSRVPVLIHVHPPLAVGLVVNLAVLVVTSRSRRCPLTG